MEKRFALFLLGLVLSIGTAFGQAKINGTVVSQEDGEAVAGASVMVQGTTTGTITDIDGKFSLNVPAGKKLVVSYIGMTTQTLTARDGMKVVLANDNHQLTEIVVTGMTQQDKRLFSGAATKIDASKAKIDGMADVSRSLEGRAAGVSVQNV
ncbi:carboxypeptidase-like regulatory domain-containing protein, partial [Prevotella multiformis]|uniref:carboxypeptidase-like regulatory domain-containing protein n=1 Tax=Prevotella multiformis TaxID=282402 RepID=UPI0023F4D2ED